MKTKVFALILNFNNPKDTILAARSLKNSDLPKNAEIVVIDNAPVDQKAVFSKQIPGAVYIKSKGNIGYAAGNNLGIRYALTQKATHILLLNPDVRVPKVFFSKLFNTFETNRDAGIVAPAHHEPGERKYGLGGHVDWATCSFPHDNVSVLPNHERKYDLLTFACVLVKAEVFKKIGLLDERYFLYLEDVDYCETAKRAGYTLYLNPKVCVTHNTSSSFADKRSKIKYSFLSSLIFIKKWYQLPHNIRPILHSLYFYPYTYLLWTLKLWKNKYYHRQ